MAALSAPTRVFQPASTVSLPAKPELYGDGDAAERIVSVIENGGDDERGAIPTANGATDG